VVGFEQGQRFRVRKLGRAAEAAVARIEGLRQLHDGARHQRRFEAGGDVVRAAELGAECGAHVGTEFGHARAMLAIGLRHALQHLGEAWPPMARRVGEIGAAEVGHLVVGCQEHGQRPAAVGLGQQPMGGLVDLVEVWALLAVDLDVDEQAIHLRGDGAVFEGLMGHDMAPVACRVAYRQENGLVLAACPRQCFRTPRVPVHRVVGVLQKVGTGGVAQAVHGVMSDSEWGRNATTSSGARASPDALNSA
jgi:hypothetical protein